jgi:hypothetical protein
MSGLANPFVSITVILLFSGCSQPKSLSATPRTKSSVPIEKVQRGPNAAPQVAVESADALDGPPDCDLKPDEISQKWVRDGSQPVMWFDKFPEAVSIWNRGFTRYTASAQLCSGTVISAAWVLTAAHCFLGENTNAASLSSGKDYETPLSSADNVYLRAGAAITLDPDERRRNVVRLIVHGGYSASPMYDNDLALLRIDRPLPAAAVPPARLAADFDRRATIIGYGLSVSDAVEGSGAYATTGHFSMGWFEIEPNGDTMSLIPNSRQEFCLGDSGGSVLAGRYRGCKRTDRASEPEPHLLQGVVSHFDHPGAAHPGVFGDLRELLRCQTATQEFMQNIAMPKYHEWICRNTKGEANGCQ